MLRLFKRLWNSPTFTTWGSMGTQSITLVAVLPLVLTRLDEREILVYYLFASVIGLQGIFRLGFHPTFIRLIGFALAGRRIADMWDLRGISSRQTEASAESVEESLTFVLSTMRAIYRWLGIACAVVLGTIGSLAMIRPFQGLSHEQEAWIAWGAIVAVSGLSITLGGFGAYLRGANHIALVNRWNAAFNLLAIASKLVLLGFFPSLMWLILVNQLWILVTLLRERQLCRWVSGGAFHRWSRGKVTGECVSLAWASSWRSGIGYVGSQATQQSLGIVFAQFGSAPFVASYLLGMRLIKTVESFGMAPFYSKIPLLNRLRSSGELDRISAVATRGVRLAHLSYFLGFAGLGLFGPFLLDFIGSNANFPRPALWYMLGAAFFFQRFGGNHIQLYSTTNHIIWHWANGLQGIVIVLSSILLAPRYGDLGFAGALLIGNFVYALYATAYSYTLLKNKALRFELNTAAVPVFGFILFGILEWKFLLSQSVTELLKNVFTWTFS